MFQFAAEFKELSSQLYYYEFHDQWRDDLLMRIFFKQKYKWRQAQYVRVCMRACALVCVCVCVCV